MHIILSRSTERSQCTRMELCSMTRAGGQELITSFMTRAWRTSWRGWTNTLRTGERLLTTFSLPESSALKQQLDRSFKFFYNFVFTNEDLGQHSDNLLPEWLRVI